MSLHHAVRALLAGSALLFLAACAAGEYALQMQLADEMDRDRTLVGTMAVGAGAREVHVAETGDGMECNGVALIGYAIPGCASSGSVRLECADGRTVTGDWEIDECRTGQGTGSDSLGNAVNFLIGDAVTDRSKPVQAEDTVPNKASTDIVLFRLGGGYAAGFDLPPETLRKQGWQVAFASRENGLIIVEVTKKAEPANRELQGMPIVLAEALPQEGNEVFIVTNDGILASSMTTGATGIITINYAINYAIDRAPPVADGLPVLDGSGEVIGLTRNRDKILQLFSSLHLRRYLELLDPQLADADVTRVSLAQLRERIIALR